MPVRQRMRVRLSRGVSARFSASLALAMGLFASLPGVAQPVEQPALLRPLEIRNESRAEPARKPFRLEFKRPAFMQSAGRDATAGPDLQLVQATEKAAPAKAAEPLNKIAETPKPQTKNGAVPLTADAKAAANPAADRKVVFNFSNAPWDAVLTRFAELADLSLVMEVRPPGTFSYADPKPHTVAEAIDLLNGVLLPKDFVLIRGDQFLTLVPLDKPLPADLAPRITETELAQRGKNELVSLMIPLKNTDPAIYGTELKGVLSKHGLVVPVGKLKLLKITDLAGHLREALPLIRQIDDQAKPGAPSAPSAPKVEKIIALKSLDNEKATKLLKLVFPSLAQIGPGADRMQLIAVASEAEIKKLTDFLAQIDTPPAPHQQSIQKAYPLKRARADTLAKALESVFGEKTGAKIAGDERNNSLLVDAPPDVQQKISLLLTDMDRSTIFDSLVERIYKPKSAEVDKLLATLQGLYASPITRISLDTSGTAIVVRASAETQEKIAKLVADLDRSDAGDGELKETVLRLKHAQADTLAATLAKLYPPTRTSVTFTADAANNLLIVRAPADTLARIKALVDQVDMPSGLGRNSETVYQPKSVPPAKLIKSLESLYPSTTNVRALPAPDGRALIISAPDELKDKVLGTLKTLDQATDDGARKVNEAYRLKHASAAELAVTLATLFPPDEHPVKFSHDAANRVIIVSAPPELQAKIKEVIERIDVPSESRLIEKLYTPENGAAETVMATLRTIYADGKSTFTLSPNGKSILALAPTLTHEKIAKTLATLGNEPDIASERLIRPKHVAAGPLVNTLQNLFANQRDVRVSIDASGQAVIVSAPPALLDKADKLIATLDKPAGDKEGEERKTYRLEHATSYYVASTLQTLFPASETGGKITYDQTSNVVVVVGPASLQEKVKALIAELDVDPKSAVVEKVYSLKSVPASRAASSLQTAFSGQRDVMVTTIAGGSKLLVAGPPSAQERSQRLLDQLDQPAGEEKREVYRIEHNQAVYVYSSLVTLFPASESSARFSYDTVGNSVIAVATPELQKEIKALIAVLDVDPKSGVVEKVYSLKSVSASRAATSLQTAFAGQRDVMIAAVAGGSKLLVAGPTAVQERAQRLLEQLDQPASEEKREVYRIEHNQAVYVYSSLVNLFPASETSARFSYDAVGNSVIAIATPELQKEIKSLIAELDVDPGKRLSEKTYVLKNVPAAQAADVLRQALATERNTTVAVGPRRDRLIVIAPPAAQARAESVIKSLDVAPTENEKPERRLYKMKHANSAGVAIALQTLYPAQTYPIVITYEGANNVVVVDAPAELQAKVKELIDQVDAPQGNRSEKVYRLTHRRASRLLTPLRGLLASSSGATVVGGPDDRSVIVSANPTDQEKVANYLKQFDAPAPDAEPEQKLYRLRHSRAANLAQSLRTLLNNEPATTISHDERNNALVVIGPADVHKKVTQWINEFDQPGEERAYVEQVFTAKHSSAEGLYRSLREVYPDIDVARFSYDNRNQTILARTVADIAPRVAETIKMLDQPKKRADRDTEVIPLYKIEPYAAENVLQSVFEDLPSDDRPSIEGVFEPPQLVIRGSADQIAEIKRVLSKMGEDAGAVAGTGQPGAGPAGSQRSIRAIRVPRGDVRTIAEAIEALWPRLRRNPLFVVTRGPRPGDLEETAKPATPALKPEDKPDAATKPAEGAKATGKTKTRDLLPGDPNVPVILTPGVNRLVASSQDPDALRLVEELVESLTDTPDFDKGEFTVFYLQSANALEVAKTIDEAFNGKREDSSGGGRQRGGGRRPDRVRAVADATANAIIVRASPVDLLNVQRLIESLDDVKLANAANKQPRILPLKHAQVDDVLLVLRGVYADYLLPGTGGPLNLPGFSTKSGEGRSAAVSVGADTRSNSVIVSAPEMVFAEIKTLVDSLDQAARESGRSYRVLPIKNASPLEVRDALEMLIDRDDPNRPRTSRPGQSSGQPRPRRPTRPARPTPNRSSTTSGGSRSGSAATEQKPPHERATEVTTIHQGEEGVTVTRERPRLLSPVVMATAGQGKDASGLDPGVIPASMPSRAAEGAEATETDRDVVGARLRDQEIAQAPAPIGARKKQEAAKPANEKPAPTQRDDGLGQLGPLSGSVEIRALPEIGVVLLLGSDQDLKLLSDIVAQIEKVTANRQLSFEVYTARRAKASELADLMTDLYTRILDARGARTGPQAVAEIIPLARPNAILIAAPKDEMEDLRDMAARFDNVAGERGHAKLIRLEHARALDISRTIEEFFRNRERDGELAPEVVVEPDRRSNTLLVHGGPADIEEVETLIAQLDVGETSMVNELRVFPLRRTVATELALTLEQAIRGRAGAQAGDGATGGGGANRADGQPALQLLTPDPRTRTAVNSGILENIRITANARANTLIVSAPPKSMSLIAAVIEQLDVLPQAMAEIKVFTLVNSDASTMALTLRNLFNQLQSQRNQVTVTPAATAGPDGNAPLVEMNFSVDERTNSILASGSREQLQVVEAIILRLDGSDIEERRTDVYRLKNATADTVAAALTNLLRAQNELTELQEGVSLQQQLEREIVVVPEDVTNSLLISSTPRFYQKLLSLIEKLDEPPPQVMIQVLIVDVTLSKGKEIGGEIGLQDSVLFDRSIYPGSALFSGLPFPYSTATNALTTLNPAGIPGFNFNTSQPLGNNPFITASNPAVLGNQGLSNYGVGRTSQRLGTGGFVFAASSESVNVLIRALMQKRRTEVLARPQIMTLDNQQAFVQVGQQFPIITGSTIAANIGVINQIAYQDIGIILQVLPKINLDGTVVMRIDPEISAIAPEGQPDSGQQIAGGGIGQQPVFARAINITRAQTTVSAADGQTAVIGGLIRKSTETIVNKVPILGDIPVVQILFRYDQYYMTKREILIFLTPHVVRSELDAERLKNQESARVDFCLQDAIDIHGALGLPTSVATGDIMPEDTVTEEGTTSVDGSAKKTNRFFSFRREKKVGASGDRENPRVIEPGETISPAIAGSGETISPQVTGPGETISPAGVGPGEAVVETESPSGRAPAGADTGKLRVKKGRETILSPAIHELDEKTLPSTEPTRTLRPAPNLPEKSTSTSRSGITIPTAAGQGAANAKTKPEWSRRSDTPSASTDSPVMIESASTTLEKISRPGGASSSGSPGVGMEVVPGSAMKAAPAVKPKRLIPSFNRKGAAKAKKDEYD